jgi:hypothetical protein
MCEVGTPIRVTIPDDCRPRTNRIEIELTGRCNLGCIHCNRFCAAAPTREEVSVNQIRRFVDEALRTETRFDAITLLGGEPFLHTNLRGVVDELARYIQWHNKLDVKIVTNGMVRDTVKVLEAIPDWIQIRSTARRKKEVMQGKLNPVFGNVFKAPFEAAGADVTACRIAQTCGLALNWYGYACCGPAAAMMRVMNLDGYAKSLRDCTEEFLMAQMHLLCGVCGRNLNYETLVAEDPSVWPFWDGVVKAWKRTGSGNCRRVYE